MTDIAIRVDNLSKLYHIGALQQRHDTLRDALTGMFRRGHQSTNPQSTNSHSDDLWALKDVSFEACPEGRRRTQRGEVAEWRQRRRLFGDFGPSMVLSHCTTNHRRRATGLATEHTLASVTHIP